MNINQYLKSIGKTKSELAEDLEISRPTLNQYIVIFEAGQKIENERYDIIFRRLFSNEKDDRKRFDKKLFAVKNLLERDKKYDIGCLEPEAADLVSRIHNIMVRDMENGKWDKKVYHAIILLLTKYKDITYMRELAGYFYDLNSGVELSELSESAKAYYSYYFKIFNDLSDDTPLFDQESYNEFIKSRDLLKKEREERRKYTTKKMTKKFDLILDEVIHEFQNKGIEANEDEIISEVLKRIKA